MAFAVTERRAALETRECQPNPQCMTRKEPVTTIAKALKRTACQRLPCEAVNPNAAKQLRSPGAEFRPLRLADGRALRRGCDGGVLILEPDDIARPDHPRQCNGIPVRQACRAGRLCRS
jgi:hypothetical protein